MKSVSSNEKGNQFEQEVYDFFRNYIENGNYIISPENCEYFRQKGYYSNERKGEIKVDVSIEVRRTQEKDYSLLIVLECKNYSDKVGVEDIEEFDRKLQQISGRNVKGMVFTREGYQKGAFEFAKSNGIALAKLIPDENIDWVLERASSPIDAKSQAQAMIMQVEQALLDSSYRSQSEKIVCYYSNHYDFSLSLILKSMVPPELQGSSQSNVSISKRVPQKVPFIGRQDIENRVSGLIKYFGKSLITDNGVDLFKICDFLAEKKQVKFCFDKNLNVEDNSKNTLGRFNLLPFEIHVTNELELNSPRWRFTLAHEIGHFLYHRDYYACYPQMNREDTAQTLTWGTPTNNSNYRLEWQANMFASALLLPRELFIRSVIEGLNECNVTRFTNGVIYLDGQKENLFNYKKILLKLNREYRTSFQAINYRLSQLNLINNRLKRSHVSSMVDNTLDGLLFLKE